MCITLTLGYGNYRFGANSEWIRHGFQDRFAHGIKPQPGYLMLDKYVLPYFNYTSNSPYSLW